MLFMLPFERYLIYIYIYVFHIFVVDFLFNLIVLRLEYRDGSTHEVSKKGPLIELRRPVQIFCIRATTLGPSLNRRFEIRSSLVSEFYAHHTSNGS